MTLTVRKLVEELNEAFRTGDTAKAKRLIADNAAESQIAVRFVNKRYRHHIRILTNRLATQTQQFNLLLNGFRRTLLFALSRCPVNGISLRLKKNRSICSDCPFQHSYIYGRVRLVGSTLISVKELTGVNCAYQDKPLNTWKTTFTEVLEE